MNCRSYSEMLCHSTYEERLAYLQLHGTVAHETFGGSRWMNQTFYKSVEWKNFRNHIIIRDNGCDLALPGYSIYGRLLLHHINPITKEDILTTNLNALMNSENIICACFDTHNAIHYGGVESINNKKLVTREPNDMSPWRR